MRASGVTGSASRASLIRTWQLSVMALLDQLQHLNPSSQAVLVENVSGRGRLFTDLLAGLAPVSEWLFAAKGVPHLGHI